MTEIWSIQAADDASRLVAQSPEYSTLFSEVELVYKAAFDARTYLRHGIELPQAPVVVDARADTGLFALFVKREFPAARVLAIEPVQPVSQALRRNVKAAGTPGVEVRQVALGSVPKSAVHFAFHPSPPGDPDGGEDVLAEVVRLSAVLAEWAPQGPVDLLKIDTGGAEIDVLLGLDPADWARIRQMVIEVQDIDGRLSRITGLLEEHGYTVTTQAAADLPEARHYSTVYAKRTG